MPNLNFNPDASAPFEEKDFKLFQDLAQQMPDLFSYFIKMPDGKVYDVHSLSYKFGNLAVELKCRKTQYSDCFIEPKKFCNLLKLNYHLGFVPVYINFLNEGNDAYIHFIKDIDPNVIALHKDQKVWSKIRQSYSVEDRYGLPWDQAYHYRKDISGQYQLISSPKYLN